MTNFEYGVSSFGVPVFPGGGELPPGINVFFVHSSGRNALGRGVYDSPFATIDYAIGQCEANKGDVIFVLPGHTETLSTAGAITADIAGVSILGLGRGSARPTLTLSAAAATIALSAANVRFSNFIVAPTGIDSVDTPVVVTGANVLIDNCQFDMSTASMQADTCITLSTGATNATVRDCKFTSLDAGAASAIASAVALAGVTIRDNSFWGTFSTAAIVNATAAWTLARIENNWMRNTHASGIGISVHSSATGFAVNNVTLVQANIAAGGSIAAAGMVKALNQGGENANITGSLQIDPAAGGFA